jgi:membrane protein CcdC involved in cytochrome C biogenesis
MGHVFPLNLQLAATLGTLFMALMVIFLRLRAFKKPTNAKKILMPPIGMSTGFLMFAFPPFRIPFTWGLAAFVTGTLLFAWPLIRTSRFETGKDGQVYLKRSKAFILILFALLIIRLWAHEYIEQFITLEQTAGVFFTLAFGMLFPWRIMMYLKYKKLKEEVQSTVTK